MNDRIRYRRRRTTRVLTYNPWNFDAEVGDLMVDSVDGALYRLEESSGWGKRTSGDLTPRRIKPLSTDMVAKIIDGEIWWIRK